MTSVADGRPNLPSGAPAASLSIAIHDRLEDVRAIWEELLPLALVSPYQSYLLQSTWMETIGKAKGLKPFVIVARDRDERPVALLPFAIEQYGPLRVASFIGGLEVNFALGLFRQGAIEPEKARHLLIEAAQRAAHPPDLYFLRNAPRRFDGVDNPLACPDALDSPSDAYGATLPQTQEELAARLSKDARKKLRKKESWLAEAGPLSYEHDPGGERAKEIVDALIAQKSARLAQKGVTLFECPATREFVKRLAAETGDGALSVHALSVGDRIVATYAGFARGGRFSAMLNSFDMDPAISRCSPGDLLLHALMRHLVDRKMTHFDLGVGEARYKHSVCDEQIELCSITIPATTKGSIAAFLLTRYVRLKRYVKSSRRLSSVYTLLRQLKPAAR